MSRFNFQTLGMTILAMTTIGHGAHAQLIPTPDLTCPLNYVYTATIPTAPRARVIPPPSSIPNELASWLKYYNLSMSDLGRKVAGNVPVLAAFALGMDPRVANANCGTVYYNATLQVLRFNQAESRKLQVPLIIEYMSPDGTYVIRDFSPSKVVDLNTLELRSKEFRMDSAAYRLTMKGRMRLRIVNFALVGDPLLNIIKADSTAPSPAYPATPAPLNARMDLVGWMQDMKVSREYLLRENEGDGLSNLNEFALRSDPNVKASFPGQVYLVSRRFYVIRFLEANSHPGVDLRFNVVGADGRIGVSYSAKGAQTLRIMGERNYREITVPIPAHLVGQNHWITVSSVTTQVH